MEKLHWLKITALSILSILVGTLMLTQIATAQEPSIYDDIPEFGGPGSVGVDLKNDNKTPATGDFIKDSMPGWFSTKKEILDKHGLAYGLNLSTLYQSASAALGEDNAWGGILQLPVSWTVLNRGGKNTGTIVFKAENRSKISTDLPPPRIWVLETLDWVSRA